MIDPKLIRHQATLVREALSKRQYPTDLLDTYIQYDDDWREALQELETLQQTRNAAVPKGKPSPDDIKELGELSNKIKSKTETVRGLEDRLKNAGLFLPNLPQDDVPVGTSEKDNREIKTQGSLPSVSFTPKPHEVLAENLDIVDFQQGRKIAGSRFSVLKGWGAKLERALINFMLDLHTQSHGYEEIMPPAIINTESLQATGQLPKFKEDQYKLEGQDLWLSPTAEVQLTNLYRNEILDESQLPIKLTAFTPCFRKEAGSYGKDIKGLIRQHQFNKIELVQIVKEDESDRGLAELLTHAEAVLQQLKLPYRVMSLCTGDLGFSAAKTFDIEVWFPAQKTYREISSCSNFLDFQARRAMIRYKGQNKGISFPHTLNGSGLAVGRTFAAILENYQQENGAIKLPDVLVPYMGTEEIN